MGLEEEDFLDRASRMINIFLTDIGEMSLEGLSWYYLATIDHLGPGNTSQCLAIGQDIQQAALSCSTRTNYRQHLPCFQIAIDPMENFLLHPFILLPFEFVRASHIMPGERAETAIVVIVFRAFISHHPEQSSSMRRFGISNDVIMMMIDGIIIDRLI